jgi:hypothetical protein
MDLAMDWPWTGPVNSCAIAVSSDGQVDKKALPKRHCQQLDIPVFRFSQPSLSLGGIVMNEGRQASIQG